MIEALETILAGLLGVCAVGALIVGYVAWRTERRADDAAADEAQR